ncbi:hypothetical protein DP939_42835 [Spongiactinospora rosea]|uniref:Uncharacterized protein n=1 Tax=Spongiactinospora rosea TaxID=2248750 RepID=A0A366LJF5_9ACTN|nr:hypothetical protein DP939_42835 [Spongiactinospora rosea]
MDELKQYSLLARLGWQLVVMGALIELRSSPHEPPTLRIFRRRGQWVPVRADMREGRPVFLMPKAKVAPPQWRSVEARSSKAAVEVRDLVRSSAGRNEA